MKKLNVDKSQREYSITTLRKRLFAIIIAITFLFLCIFARLLYVQVIWGDKLQEKAIDQWTREIPIIASRGVITDANGVVLATNQDTYTIFVRKKAITEREKLIDVLSSVLGLTKEYVKNRLDKTISSEITIAKQVSKQKIDEILAHNLGGLYYSRDNSRLYPFNDTLSSVVGFTSNDGKGQSGLELYYDKYLSGIDGEILYETDIVGVEIDGGKASYLPSTPGLNIKLTIDYDIQQLCETAMQSAMEIHKPKSAQIIVLDPKTGAIKALCTKPSINLNEIPRDDLDALNALSRNGLVCDIYEPGSTFKVLTVAANVEEYLNGNKDAYSLDHVFNSGRYRYIDGQKIKCWNNHENGKHDSLNIQGALNNSCNPIFVDIAMALGKTTMYEYIEKFNYGSCTGVDFNGEAQGMVIPESAIQNVDLARISFGQTIAVTGLQLACATSAAINGGNYYEPYLLSEIYSHENKIVEKILPKLKNKVISQKASQIMCQLLEGVVKDGSGRQAYIEGYRVGGKTGTAQKYENGIIAQGKYVSSFVGFFPANDPKYLALAIIDEPVGSYYGSTVAAPFVREVFEGIIKIKGISPCK